MFATPSVCTLVRKLTLGVSKSSIPFHIVFNSFFAVLQRLPCLSVLILENVVFAESSDGEEYKHGAIATPSRPSTRLEHLVFWRCGIDLTGLINIVSRFDIISSLGISITQNSPSGNLFTVRTERASFMTGATRVQSLSLYKTSVEDLRSFGKAIDLEHLQHIILVMDMQNGETELLRACKNLKSLTALIYRTYILIFLSRRILMNESRAAFPLNESHAVKFTPSFDLSSCYNLTSLFIDFADVYSVVQCDFICSVIRRSLLKSLPTLPHRTFCDTDSPPFKLTIRVVICMLPVDTPVASDVHLALAQDEA